jgi:hypothetical protein
LFAIFLIMATKRKKRLLRLLNISLGEKKMQEYRDTLYRNSITVYQEPSQPLAFLLPCYWTKKRERECFCFFHLAFFKDQSANSCNSNNNSHHCNRNVSHQVASCSQVTDWCFCRCWSHCFSCVKRSFSRRSKVTT